MKNDHLNDFYHQFEWTWIFIISFIIIVIKDLFNWLIFDKVWKYTPPNIVSLPIMQEFRALPGLHSGIFRIKIEDFSNKTFKHPNPKPAYNCPFAENRKETL